MEKRDPTHPTHKRTNMGNTITTALNIHGVGFKVRRKLIKMESQALVTAIATVCGEQVQQAKGPERATKVRAHILGKLTGT